MIKKIKYVVVSIGILLLLSNKMIAQTVDLSAHTTSTATLPVSVQWHNSSNPSASSLLSNTTVTATSTPANYWVYYYDSANNCYSPGSKVTVMSSACPSLSVDLTVLAVTPSAPAGSVLQWHIVQSGFIQTGTGQTLVSNPNAVGTGTYYPVFYDNINNCYSQVGTPVIVSSGSCHCYKPAVIDSDNSYPTNHGITALGRAGKDTGNWPMIRQSGWTVLEAKTLGFVINRIKTTSEVNALPSPVEGMIVYDVEADCLKVYTTVDNGVSFGWHCLSQQACP